MEASCRYKGYYLAAGRLLGGVRAAPRCYLVVVGYLRGGRRTGAGRYNIYNRKCQPPVITGAAAVTRGFLSARRRAPVMARALGGGMVQCSSFIWLQLRRAREGAAL